MKKENGVLEEVTNEDLKLLETNPEEFWSGVTKIDYRAFEDVDDLVSITIPDSVIYIDNQVFKDCEGLTSITIPDSVQQIGNPVFGEEAFSNCTNLTAIKVDAGNKYYSSEYGVLYNKDKTNLICCPAGKTSITIPDSVTKIGDCAFFGCTGLTSITIPDSVTEIEGRAFSGCTGLTSITIPDSVIYIDGQVFKDCEGLTSITIPDSVTGIGRGAFEGCTGLTSITIPDSVTKIGDDAFKGCTGLTEVTIPDSVTRIGRGAFKGCTGLKGIIVSRILLLDDSSKFDGLQDKLIEVETKEIKADEYYLDLVKKSPMTIDLFPVEKFSEDFIEKLKEAVHKCFEAEIEKIDVENEYQYNDIIQKMEHVKATIDNKQEKYKQYKKEEEIRNRAKDARKNELKDRLNELFPEEDDDGKAE